MGKALKPKIVNDRSASKSHARKLKKRRTRWEWNFPLLLKTLIAAAIIFVGGFFSYQHFSKAAASEFRSQAVRAEEEGRIGDQISWLTRYSRLHPEDTDILVKIARITDDRVDQTAPAKRRAALNAATNAILIAIGRLGPDKSDVEKELRQKINQTVSRDWWQLVS